MQGVIMLNVIMLSVVGPNEQDKNVLWDNHLVVDGMGRIVGSIPMDCAACDVGWRFLGQFY